MWAYFQHHIKSKQINDPQPGVIELSLSPVYTQTRTENITRGKTQLHESNIQCIYSSKYNRAVFTNKLGEKIMTRAVTFTQYRQSVPENTSVMYIPILRSEKHDTRSLHTVSYILK